MAPRGSYRYEPRTRTDDLWQIVKTASYFTRLAYACLSAFTQTFFKEDSLFQAKQQRRPCGAAIGP
jgi:hypothetical protein